MENLPECSTNEKEKGINECVVFKKLIEELVTSCPFLIPDSEHSDFMDTDNMSSNGSQNNNNYLSLETLMRSAFSELRMIVEWARRVPEFDSLQMTDRVCLLKSSFMDLYALRVAYRSMSTPGHIRFSSDIHLTPDECASIGWSKEAALASLKFVQRLQRVQLDQTEFAIVNAVVLFYPDSTGLVNRQRVLQIQNTFIECLADYCLHPNSPLNSQIYAQSQQTANQSQVPFSTLFPSDRMNTAEDSRYTRNGENASILLVDSRCARITMQLQQLRNIGSRTLEQFIRCSQEGRVQMDDLVVEMLS